MTLPSLSCNAKLFFFLGGAGWELRPVQFLFRSLPPAFFWSLLMLQFFVGAMCFFFLAPIVMFQE